MTRRRPRPVHRERAKPGLDVTGGLHDQVGMRQQRLRGRQRFGRTIARDQERRPFALVDRLHQQVGRNVERLLQQRFRLAHLAGVLIRRRQQIEIVRVMPVELRRDLFARQVVALQLVGGFESRDRFVDAAKPAQFVAVHVDRVRHAGFCAAYAAACASASFMRPVFS